MSYSLLTIKERYQIEAYVLEDHSVRKIASLMKVHPSTISRELKRSPGQYFAERAEPMPPYAALPRGDAPSLLLL